MKNPTKKSRKNPENGITHSFIHISAAMIEFGVGGSPSILVCGTLTHSLFIVETRRRGGRELAWIHYAMAGTLGRVWPQSKKLGLHAVVRTAMLFAAVAFPDLCGGNQPAGDTGLGGSDNYQHELEAARTAGCTLHRGVDVPGFPDVGQINIGLPGTESCAVVCLATRDCTHVVIAHGTCYFKQVPPSAGNVLGPSLGNDIVTLACSVARVGPGATLLTVSPASDPPTMGLECTLRPGWFFAGPNLDEGMHENIPMTPSGVKLCAEKCRAAFDLGCTQFSLGWGLCGK